MAGIPKVVDYLLHVHGLVEQLDAVLVIFLENCVLAHPNLHRN